MGMFDPEFNQARTTVNRFKDTAQELGKQGRLDTITAQVDTAEVAKAYSTDQRLTGEYGGKFFPLSTGGLLAVAIGIVFYGDRGAWISRKDKKRSR